MSENDEGAGVQGPDSPEPAPDGSSWGAYVPPAQDPTAPAPQYPEPPPPPDTIADTVVFAPIPPSSNETVVAPPARRRRRGVTAVLAVSCGAVVGTGTWLGLGILDKAPGITATEQLDEWDNPASATGEQEVEAPWTVAWGVTYEPELVPYTPDFLAASAVFDDGLDHANLPPLVPRTSLAYPEAHQMTDDIWDAAGPGWMLASYGDQPPCGERPSRNPDPTPAPVFDLVSPEGVHFRLPAPIGATDSYGGTPGFYTIDYANLSEGWAIVTTGTFSCYEGGGGDTLVWFDLRTGGVIDSVPTEDEMGDSDAQATLEAAGPLVGGAEVRLRHHRNSDPEEGDGLFVWTPEEGEVAIEIPEGIALGDLSILGVADANVGIVVLETPNSWAQNWMNSASSDRFYVLDAPTRELREVFPVVPDGVTALTFDGLTPTALIERAALPDAEGVYRVHEYVVPFDGSTPSDIGIEGAYRLALEPDHLVPVVECPDNDCRVVAIDDPSGATVLASLGGYYYLGFSLDSFDSTPWSDGLQTVITSQGWRPIVVEVDPVSGDRLEPFPSWIPDTGARSGLINVFVFASTPDEG